MNQDEHIDFAVFLERFTLIEPPVQLDDTSYQDINALSEPFPGILVSTFIKRTGSEEDLAEYVPVFRLPDLPGIISLVFWRAGILQYDYILGTYTPEGDLIDQKVISSTIYSDDKTIKSIAKFDEEGLITVVEGIEDTRTGVMIAANSKQLFFEILENGNIQQSLKFSI